MARLILSFDGRELPELPVGTRGMAIGRSPDNDVMIDNLAVSNHHARISWVEEQLFVEDLQNLNGIFVNEMRDFYGLRDFDAGLHRRRSETPRYTCGATCLPEDGGSATTRLSSAESVSSMGNYAWRAECGYTQSAR